MRILFTLLLAAGLQAQDVFPGAAAVDQQMERAIQDGLIPGAVVLIGHNGQVAWAITHASADTQDLYLEWFDSGRPGWYRTGDGWAQAARRTETIRVRGGEPVETEVWATRHGQVVHGDPLAGLAIALKYTATSRPGRGFEPLLPMLAARAT